ncbi:ANTAR domain-containing protein [Humibacillus xanthopallidus]|uniref:ANTAR domain-containing protein n=1 Tax=Humibacillus xanthopallidus TaxID=412689 RepID=UPI00163AB9FA|nr:ANTAR domain-containing protein [Humibacillus xanthopallidus]
MTGDDRAADGAVAPGGRDRAPQVTISLSGHASLAVADGALEAVDRLLAELEEPQPQVDPQMGWSEADDALRESRDAVARALAVVDGAAPPVLRLVDRAVFLRRERDHLRVALMTNRVIAAAVGILMALRQLTYDEAYALLLDCSQTRNRKLREVAADVLETGALPNGKGH